MDKAKKTRRFEMRLEKKLFAHLTLRAAESSLTRVGYVRQLVVGDMKMWKALSDTKYPEKETERAK